MATNNIVKLTAFILMINNFCIEAKPIDGLPVNPIAKRQADFQCRLGPMFSSTLTRTFVADQNSLYVDISRPATCSGRITSVEMCFVLDNESSASLSVDVIVLRRQGTDYRIVDSQLVPANPFSERDDQLTTNAKICQNITLTNDLRLYEGDFIGFSCRNAIRIAFTEVPNQRGDLRSVDDVQPVFGLETIADGRLRTDSRNESELPMFRVTIGKSVQLLLLPQRKNFETYLLLTLIYKFSLFQY